MIYRNLYKALIPKKIRTRIYKLHIRQYQEQEKQRFITEHESVPQIELSPIYISNLKLLIDRDYLLHMMPKNAVVAKIGVDKGEFSEHILSITNPAILHLIDAWGSERYQEGLMQIVEDKFIREINTGQVIINRGFSNIVLTQFENDYFDWVYIDTDHSYKKTFEELEICRLKVKPGGLISGHDYITGNWIGKIRYGVIEAVHKFCKENRWEMIYLTHESHRHLSFALREITSRP